jgi:hypothetical protein
MGIRGRWERGGRRRKEKGEGGIDREERKKLESEESWRGAMGR